MGTDHSVTPSLVSFPLGAGTGETGTLSPHLVALCVLSKPQALGKGQPRGMFPPGLLPKQRGSCRAPWSEHNPNWDFWGIL